MNMNIKSGGDRIKKSGGDMVGNNISPEYSTR